MKVLLLGEFSGFYKNLKIGLEKNGIDVSWYGSQDGFKKIDGMDRDVEGHSGFKIFDKIIYPIILVLTLKKYDVIQIVNPMIFSPRINKFLMEILRKKTKVLALSGAGTDYTVYQYGKKRNYPYKYNILDNSSEYDIFYANNQRYIENDQKVLELCDVLIPVSLDYELAYKDFYKRAKTIRLSLDVDSIKYIPNVVHDKIVFFHGLNREIFKGTSYIREALEKLKNNYPNDVEVVMVGHMPFQQYVEKMGKVNVVLDQCKSYGLGINALLAMAQGKIMLGGAEDLSIEGVGPLEYPIINITPDSGQIYRELEKIVMNRDHITEWGRKTREFIEKYYDSKDIAKEYIQIWCKELENK